ncbi:uncharacterized protein MAM_08076 [Metarhizium album ARSEF 1941]|uniref:Uncharacterized protein n=1 Tax=Metarhizium album (strain ARSEF 1941) TaxID=1081103 RepID=A0A0B2WKQ5_METAS|nr:uncharacterized protein MAM_08076 [Metarhizium album ARSEF 1941]KHN94067.1 hypothetical protein MAM_08076 [Metarhizium album ARSEF 1941]
MRCVAVVALVLASFSRVASAVEFRNQWRKPSGGSIAQKRDIQVPGTTDKPADDNWIGRWKADDGADVDDLQTDHADVEGVQVMEDVEDVDVDESTDTGDTTWQENHIDSFVSRH